MSVINQDLFSNKLSNRLLERVHAETSFELIECAKCGFYNTPVFTPRKNLDAYELQLLKMLNEIKSHNRKPEVRDFWPAKSKNGFWHYLCEPCAKAKVGK